MSYKGDFRLNETIDVKFTTISSTGAPITLAGTPAVSAYPGNSTTELTAGITLTVDFDARTGLHNVRVVATAANGYAAATNYSLVITAGTVDGVSVVGYVIGSFSLEARSALMPTTAARTLDVTAGGNAGVDWANVEAPTTTLGLTNTTVGVVTLTNTLTTYTGNTVQTGDAFARLGAPAGASVSADILVLDNLVDDLESRLGTPSNLGSGATVAANLADIEAQTDDIGSAGAGLTAVPWNAAWDAEVQSEAEDALVTHRLDELLNADSDIDGAAPPTVGSVFHELMSKTAGSFTFDQATDALEALRDRGDAAWTTATGFSTHSAADVWSAVTRTLTAGTNIALAKGTGVTGFTDLSAADVRTALGLAAANLDTQIGDLPTNSELTTALNTLLTTAMTESYAADGATMTPAQALYLLVAVLTEFAISGTTLTAKKVDGSTTAATFTLNSATEPTSITRAS